MSEAINILLSTVAFEFTCTRALQLFIEKKVAVVSLSLSLSVEFDSMASGIITDSGTEGHYHACEIIALIHLNLKPILLRISLYKEQSYINLYSP